MVIVRTKAKKLKEVLLIGFRSLNKSALGSFPKDFLLVDLIAQINTMAFELSLAYEEIEQKIM